MKLSHMSAEPKHITTHPPLKRGEAFLGNTCKGLDDDLKGVSGLVLRRPAYSIDGELLEPRYQALISTNQSAYDAYNNIREAQLSAIRSGMKKP